MKKVLFSLCCLSVCYLFTLNNCRAAGCDTGRTCYFANEKGVVECNSGSHCFGINTQLTCNSGAQCTNYGTQTPIVSSGARAQRFDLPNPNCSWANGKLYCPLLSCPAGQTICKPGGCCPINNCKINGKTVRGSKVIDAICQCPKEKPVPCGNVCCESREACATGKCK